MRPDEVKGFWLAQAHVALRDMQELGLLVVVKPEAFEYLAGTMHGVYDVLGIRTMKETPEAE